MFKVIAKSTGDIYKVYDIRLDNETIKFLVCKKDPDGQDSWVYVRATEFIQYEIKKPASRLSREFNVSKTETENQHRINLVDSRGKEYSLVKWNDSEGVQLSIGSGTQECSILLSKQQIQQQLMAHFNMYLDYNVLYDDESEDSD